MTSEFLCFRDSHTRVSLLKTGWWILHCIWLSFFTGQVAPSIFCKWDTKTGYLV